MSTATAPAKVSGHWIIYENRGWKDAREVCVLGDHLIADGKRVLVEARGHSCLYCVLTKGLIAKPPRRKPVLADWEMD